MLFHVAVLVVDVDAQPFQTKDNVLPFLTLAQAPAVEEVGGRHYLQWVMENQGFGPAINVKHIFYLNSATLQRPSIMQGKFAVICNGNTPDAETLLENLKAEGGFAVEYESIAGERFKSTFRVLDAKTVDVSFANLSRK